MGKVYLPASRKEFTWYTETSAKKVGSLFSVAKFKSMVTVDAVRAGTDQSVPCPRAQVKDGGKSLSLVYRGRLY